MVLHAYLPSCFIPEVVMDQFAIDVGTGYVSGVMDFQEEVIYSIHYVWLEFEHGLVA